MKIPLILTLSVFLLSACAGGGPRLEPPQLSFVEMQLNRAEATLDARVRLRNTSAKKLPITGLNFEWFLDGRRMGTFSPDISYDIPALGSEVFSISSRVDQQVLELFKVLDDGKRSNVPYEISGELWHSGGDGRMTIDSSGYLSPTPGKPGNYR